MGLFGFELPIGGHFTRISYFVTGRAIALPTPAGSSVPLELYPWSASR
jgi:hypothetical protein